MKLNLLFLILISTTTTFAQQSKKQVKTNIENWYTNHPNKYVIDINKNVASAEITRYHPYRKDEKNDLIRIIYQGMKITLAFTKPINEITTHKDSLQKYYSYVGIDNIYIDIDSKGWDVHPETPSSSMRNKGVIFTKGGDSISLSIKWSIFTVMGYKDSKKCNNERSIMDVGISESCYVSVRKRLPLEISINKVHID